MRWTDPGDLWRCQEKVPKLGGGDLGGGRGWRRVEPGEGAAPQDSGLRTTAEGPGLSPLTRALRLSVAEVGPLQRPHLGRQRGGLSRGSLERDERAGSPRGGRGVRGRRACPPHSHAIVIPSPGGSSLPPSHGQPGPPRRLPSPPPPPPTSKTPRLQDDFTPGSCPASARSPGVLGQRPQPCASAPGSRGPAGPRPLPRETPFPRAPGTW